GRRMNRRLATLVQRYVARFYDHCALVTSASHSLGEDLVVGGFQRRVVIIPNGTDTAIFRPRPRPSGSELPLRLLYLGRLASDKNLPRLIELLKPVFRRHPSAQLDIVGRGPLKHELATIVRRARLEKQVHLVGAISERDTLA